MSTIAKILTAVIALEHVYILCLEMFMWTTPRALKTFGMTPEFARASQSLAANQGLYNGFLAAGLLWSIVHPDNLFAPQIAVFFLVCVVVAGVYGGLTAKRSILYVQALPAAVALAAVLLNI